MEDITDRMRTFWEEAFNGRDLSRIENFVAPEFVNHAALPGTPSGPEGQRQLMVRLWDAFPDGRFDIEHLAADGDVVICVGIMSGTHSGTLMGVPATGRAAKWRQCHLFKVDDQGRALEHSAIRDDLGLMRQLGIMPGPT